MKQIDFNALAEQFRDGGVCAISLMGSYARRDAGDFSDIDLVRFREVNGPEHDAETHLVNRMFVVVSDVTPALAEAWFTDPDRASSCIMGVRTAMPLWDPQGYFAALQRRADAFVWDESMQIKANSWASEQMVGWIEEVQKGLEGLRRNDEGRMLNARYGLSWGLTNVMRVQRGVLITGDNGTYPEVVESVGRDSHWVRLSRRAFGITNGLSLRDQVASGLCLYLLTVELIEEVIQHKHKTLIEEVTRRIRNELERTSNKPVELDRDGGVTPKD